MTNIIKSDIFFFVTAVAVVIVTICIIIMSFYVIRILKDLKIISQKAKDESQKIIDDVTSLRQNVVNRGVEISQFFSFISYFFGGQKKNIKKGKTGDITK